MPGGEACYVRTFYAMQWPMGLARQPRNLFWRSGGRFRRQLGCYHCPRRAVSRGADAAISNAEMTDTAFITCSVCGGKIPIVNGHLKMKHRLTLLFILLIGTLPLFAQTGKSSSNGIVEPRKLTYCELAKDPSAYNHELVRLTTFVTHGFEDFHIAEPNCATSQQHFSVWVMYGGKAESNTAYCCPGESSRETRPESLNVEGVQVPLVNDLMFQQFTDLLKKEQDTTVRVTVVGRFFSGAKQAVRGRAFGGGFGHMGCCSLFVIQRVEWFEPHTRSDLDYTSEAGWYEKEGCNYRSLRYQRHVSIPYPDGTAEQVITEQRLAETGQTWAFSDPQRVAVESLKPFYGDQIPVLRSLEKTEARHVFQWKNGKKSVVVVVTRPYWLSFYATSSSVAWVSTTIKESDCR